MMKGWKTWAAAVGLVIMGVVELANGDTEGGLTCLVSALGLIGIGHKVEKAA